MNRTQAILFAGLILAAITMQAAAHHGPTDRGTPMHRASTAAQTASVSLDTDSPLRPWLMVLAPAY